MKNLLFPIFASFSFLLTSCKEDEATKQKITDLESTIAGLEADKVGLEADVISLKASQAGISPGDAKALTERKDALEIEVQRLLPFEAKVKELTQQNQELSEKLAAATMTAKPSATAGGAAPSGSEISKAVADSFVTIEGDHHSGGGFLAGEGDKIYLYTAASVLAGNQKLTIRVSTGQALKKFGNLELCDGIDIARMQVMDDVEAKLEMVALDAVISDRVDVLALGMGPGSNVVSTEKFSISSASGTAFVLDNSNLQSAIGAPIIHAISGKVVGVLGQAAVAPSLWPNEGSAPIIQQVVARLNQKIAWVETKIGGFLLESKRIQEFDDATRLALAVTAIPVGQATPQLDGTVPNSTLTVRQVMMKYESHPLSQTFLKWKGDDPSKKIAASEADIKKKWRGVMGDAVATAQRGIADLKPAAFSWYHRAWVESSLKARQQVLEDLNDAFAAGN